MKNNTSVGYISSISSIQDSDCILNLWTTVIKGFRLKNDKVSQIHNHATVRQNPIKL